MISDITLGQYFPGDTVIHRLDPRVKLSGMIVYITALFMAEGAAAYLLCAAWLFMMILLSKTTLNFILKGIKPLVVIIIFTAVLNVFYTGGRPVFTFYFITVTYEGLRLAFYMVVRIIMLITGTSLLTYTTSPIMLTDGIERLLNPLKKLRVPVSELAMMMTIALRFIPTLVEETEKIMSAQKARGADFESGNVMQRARALIPILVPLFVSAFRRADDLATAMECRLYHGGEGRTRLREISIRRRDILACVLLAALFVLVVAASRLWPL